MNIKNLKVPKEPKEGKECNKDKECTLTLSGPEDFDRPKGRGGRIYPLVKDGL